MTTAPQDVNVHPLVRASYVMLLSSLAVGMMLVPFDVRAALMAAAAIFGWSQIGGA